MHQLQFANNFETKGVFLGERLFSDVYLKMRTFLLLTFYLSVAMAIVIFVITIIVITIDNENL